MLLTLAATLAGAVLYRVRGGWLKEFVPSIGSTPGRLLWTLPTAALAAWLAGAGWLVFAALCASVLAAASLGHGAHMIFDAKVAKAMTAAKTEMLTAWWLPRVWGGQVPDDTWPDDEVNHYNMMGMSFIGAVRNALALLPLAFVAPVGVALYAATGLAHGPLYWLGWRITPDIRAAEFLVGALSWATIAMVLA